MTHKRDTSEDPGAECVLPDDEKYKHTFTGEGEFRTWMYHLGRNALNDWVKQNRSFNFYDVNEVADRMGGSTQPTKVSRGSRTRIFCTKP